MTTTETPEELQRSRDAWVRNANVLFARLEGLQDRVLKALESCPGLSEEQHEDLHARALQVFTLPVPRHAYRHIRKDTTYDVVAGFRMRVPADADGTKWVEAVLYRSIEDGQLYGRKLEDFYGSGEFKPDEVSGTGD